MIKVAVNVCGLGDLVILLFEFHVPCYINGCETLHVHSIMSLGNVTKVAIGW